MTHTSSDRPPHRARARPCRRRRRAGAAPGARAAEGGEDRHAGAAVRSLGAPRHPGTDGRPDGGGRREQRRRHQVDGRRQAASCWNSTRRIRRRRRRTRHSACWRRNPDLVGGFGCWLSTFTLAVTEVTERAQLPWLTLSLFRPDHRPRLQIRVPVLADRGAAGRGHGAGHHGSGARRRPASGRPRWD